MITTLIIVIIWTIISVIYFIYSMGDKFRKEKWYDFPLMIPALGIAIILGMLYNKKNSKGNKR